MRQTFFTLPTSRCAAAFCWFTDSATSDRPCRLARPVPFLPADSFQRSGSLARRHPGCCHHARAAEKDRHSSVHTVSYTSLRAEPVLHAYPDPLRGPCPEL